MLNKSKINRIYIALFHHKMVAWIQYKEKLQRKHTKNKEACNVINCLLIEFSKCWCFIEDKRSAIKLLRGDNFVAKPVNSVTTLITFSASGFTASCCDCKCQSIPASSFVWWRLQRLVTFVFRHFCFCFIIIKLLWTGILSAGAEAIPKDVQGIDSRSIECVPLWNCVRKEEVLCCYVLVVIVLNL